MSWSPNRLLLFKLKPSTRKLAMQRMSWPFGANLPSDDCAKWQMTLFIARDKMGKIFGSDFSQGREIFVFIALGFITTNVME